MEKAHESKDLDLSCAARGVWLVKVPKYLSDSWKKAGSSGGEVGKLMITKSKSATDVQFCVNEQLTNGSVEPSSNEQIPIAHKFVLTGLDSQMLSIMSTEPLAGYDVPNGSQNPLPDLKVAIEGKVIQRAECQPVKDNENYIKFNKIRLEKQNKPHRQVIQLDKAINSYKPKSVHASSMEYDLKKKEEGKKIRGDHDRVTDMLFGAFEKHQYYNVKDLVRVTNQPITYLKEILKEICIYNMKAPHKNMWELKPEYRHYKPTPETS